jgi:hypothetical protein
MFYSWIKDYKIGYYNVYPGNKGLECLKTTGSNIIYGS